LAYAEAAEETGRKPWVTEALRWCHDFAVYFLQGGGAAELAVKAERRRFFQAFGERMTDAEITATRDKFLNGHLGMDGDPGLVPFARRGAARVSSGEEKEKELSNTTESASAGCRLVLGLLPRVHREGFEQRVRGCVFGLRAAHA
jgi:hypothetical protein